MRFGAPRHCSPNHSRATSSTMDSLVLIAGISSRGGLGGRGDVSRSSLCEHHQTDLRIQSFGENSPRLLPPRPPRLRVSLVPPSLATIHPPHWLEVTRLSTLQPNAGSGAKKENENPPERCKHLQIKGMNTPIAVISAPVANPQTRHQTPRPKAQEKSTRFPF